MTQKDSGFFLLFLLPSIILVVGLLTYPVLNVLHLSFTDKHTLYRDFSFIGFENYASFLSRPDFATALINTLVWTTSIVGLTIIAGLITALLVNQSIPGQGLIRSLVLFPYLVPVVVAALVWRYMLNDLFGVINWILRWTGISTEPILWLSSTKWAMPALILVGTWKYTPFCTIAFLAALQAIPKDLIEAAKVDGASIWARFRFITLPLITPVIIVTALLRTLYTFNEFEILYMLTGGGPLDATTTLPILAYKEAFGNMDVGRGAAIAIIMLVCLSLISFAYLKYYPEEP